jgi:flagellar hook-basal body complex protein FliE
MEIGSLGALQQALQAASQKQAPQLRTGQPGAATQGFGSALDSALKSVSHAQNESAVMVKAYQTGDPAVGLEQTMASMQKAQVSFQAALTVRNRLVAAYTDIMNMQV